MQCVAALVTTLALVLPAQLQAQDADRGAGSPVVPTADLQWKNGDMLQGRLLSSPVGRLRWSTPLFAEPVDVDLEAIAGVWWNGPSILAEEDFEVRVKSGDVLVANLVAADDGTQTSRSTGLD